MSKGNYTINYDDVQKIVLNKHSKVGFLIYSAFEIQTKEERKNFVFKVPKEQFDEISSLMVKLLSDRVELHRC